MQPGEVFHKLYAVSWNHENSLNIICDNNL